METAENTDQSRIFELQSTIQQLRELLEQATHDHKKQLAHKKEQFQAAESRHQQTIIELRKQITALQFRNQEQLSTFEHSKKLLDDEKISIDHHFQSHMHQVRSQFEQTIQALQLKNQHQEQYFLQQINELQSQIKSLRKTLEDLKISQKEVDLNG